MRSGVSTHSVCRARSDETTTFKIIGIIPCIFLCLHLDVEIREEAGEPADAVRQKDYTESYQHKSADDRHAAHEFLEFTRIGKEDIYGEGRKDKRDSEA